MCYTETQMTSELLDQPRFTGEPTKIFDLFDAEKRQLYAVPLHDQCRARGAARIFQPNNHAHYTVDLWAAGSAGKVNIFSGIGLWLWNPTGYPQHRLGNPRIGQESRPAPPRAAAGHRSAGSTWDHPADRQRQDEVAQPRLRSAGPRVEA
jgi:hypothetical protein